LGRHDGKGKHRSQGETKDAARQLASLREKQAKIRQKDERDRRLADNRAATAERHKR
jgi:hypothetical protein